MSFGFCLADISCGGLSCLVQFFFNFFNGGFECWATKNEAGREREAGGGGGSRGGERQRETGRQAGRQAGGRAGRQTKREKEGEKEIHFLSKFS